MLAGSSHGRAPCVCVTTPRRRTGSKQTPVKPGCAIPIESILSITYHITETTRLVCRKQRIAGARVCHSTSVDQWCGCGCGCGSRRPKIRQAVIAGTPLPALITPPFATTTPTRTHPPTEAQLLSFNQYQVFNVNQKIIRSTMPKSPTPLTLTE